MKKNRPQSSSLQVEALKIAAGGVLGIGLAILLLWFVFRRDPLGIMSNPNADEEVAAKPADPQPPVQPKSPKRRRNPKPSRQPANDPKDTDGSGPGFQADLGPSDAASTPENPLDSPPSEFDGRPYVERFTELRSAFVRVPVGGFRPLTSGSKLFGDGDDTWSKIPEGLEGVYFLTNPNAQQGATQFKVEQAGWVLMAATDLPEEGETKTDSFATSEKLKSAGWHPVERLESTVGDETRDWLVFARHCQGGESFSYQTSAQGRAPILLLAPGQ